MNILLVEDNPADARLIGETLKESHAVTFRLTHRERLADALASIGSCGLSGSSSETSSFKS